MPRPPGRRLRTLALWMVAGAVVGALLGFSLSLMDREPPPQAVMRGVLGGFLLGGLVWLEEDVLVPRWLRVHGFWRLTVSRVTFLAISITSVVLLVNTVGLSYAEGLTPGEAVATFLRRSGARDLSLVVVLSVGFAAVFQVARLHTPLEIWHLLSGRYHYPLEERRVFLFADLTGSTALAQRLGALQYSHFIRDLFADLSNAIALWKGSVYQYEGDGLLVSWPWRQGLTDAAAVRCFHAMCRALHDRANHYQERYDTVPRLHGAIHGGTVVATRVGTTRSHLAFHGDPLNVTSRLLSRCSSSESDLLMSSVIRSELGLAADLSFVSLGEADLRGRDSGIEVFAVGLQPRP